MSRIMDMNSVPYAELGFSPNSDLEVLHQPLTRQITGVATQLKWTLFNQSRTYSYEYPEQANTLSSGYAFRCLSLYLAYLDGLAAEAAIAAGAAGDAALVQAAELEIIQQGSISVNVAGRNKIQVPVASVPIIGLPVTRLDSDGTNAIITTQQSYPPNGRTFQGFPLGMGYIDIKNNESFNVVFETQAALDTTTKLLMVLDGYLFRPAQG